MIRDVVLLDTKKHELQDSINHRKRKLAELYRVTRATVGATARSVPNHIAPYNPNAEAEFVEANDITQGRYFNVATLQRIPGADAILNYSDHGPSTTNFQSQEATNGNYEHQTELELPEGTTVPDRARKSPQSPKLAVRRSPASIGNIRPATHDLPEDLEVDPIPVGSLADQQPKVFTATGNSTSRKEDNSEPGGITTVPPATLRSAPETHSDNDGHKDTVLRPALVTGRDTASTIITTSLSKAPADTLDADGAATPASSLSLRLAGSETEVEQKATPLVGDRTVASTPENQLLMEAAQFGDRGQGSTISQRGKSIQQAQVKHDPPASSGAMPEETGDLSEHPRLSQGRKVPGMSKESSKDLTFSQRPPMRIDTGIARLRRSSDAITTSVSPGPLNTAQPTTRPTTRERMTTRVSSGAIRHRSVSEILGETPRSVGHLGDRTPVTEKSIVGSPRDDGSSQISRHGPSASSPESTSFRSRLGELKEREKDRSRLSTVVFARQQPTGVGHDADQGAMTKGFLQDNQDYLITLFAAQASGQSPSLNQLLGSARKTLSTANHYVDFHESQDCRILKKIYHLQNSNRWSLRQIKRSVEPERPATQWDVLLTGVKWIRTDFKEERKWKITAAKNLADWCTEWVNTTDERRASLQIRASRRRRKSSAVNDHVTPISLNHADMDAEPTPDLVSPAEDDMSDIAEDEVQPFGTSRAYAPAAVFSLAPEDVLFGLEKTPISEKLLSELPLFQPLAGSRHESKLGHDSCTDEEWRRPIVPVSKYAVGKMVIKDEGPMCKKSRFEYAEEDEVDRPGNNPLPPEQVNVAMFNPDNKHIMARLHAGHAFRPPSEFPMPTQSFFECRQPSQWTRAEDDQLRRLAKDYEYNWSLISACLSSPSLFSSGAERRTPWECFERWVNFEGFPGDMGRHQYFRAWGSRRNSARLHLEQQFAAQQQQAANGAHLQPRRKSGEPVSVERRRNNKHLALVHAMSKVAKKKETALQKQQHVASLAAMRKAAEPVQSRQRMQTPQEFSAHKFKQECEFKERRLVYQQQMAAANQRALLAQKAGQASKDQLATVLPQGGRSGIPMAGTSPHITSTLPQGPLPSGAHGRLLPPSQGMMAGMGLNGMQAANSQMSARGAGVPQAQMQSYIPGPQRLPSQNGPDSARVIMAASRVSEQQRFMQQQQQYNTPGVNGSPPHHGNMTMPPQQNSTMLASLQSQGGKLSPVMNGVSAQSRSPSSPRMVQPAHAQQLSNGVVPILGQVANRLKTQYPDATDAQIKQMATMKLNEQLRHNQQQAVGANGIQSAQHQGMNFNGQMNPQMYAQAMRSQQMHQQNHVGSLRPESQGANPQMNNGSGTGQSPRPPQAQMAAPS